MQHAVLPHPQREKNLIQHTSLLHSPVSLLTQKLLVHEELRFIDQVFTLSPGPSFMEEAVLSRDQTLCLLLLRPDWLGVMGTVTSKHVTATCCVRKATAGFKL